MEPNAFYIRQTMKHDFFEKWLSLGVQLFKGGQVQLTFNFNFNAFDKTVGAIQASDIINHGEIQTLRTTVANLSSVRLVTAAMKTHGPDTVRVGFKSDESTGFGVVTVTFHNSPDTKMARATLAAVESTFECMPWPSITSSTIPQIQLDALKLQEQTVAALAAEVAKVGQHALDAQRRVEQFLLDAQKQLNEHRQHLEEDDRRRRLEAEEAQKKRDEEYANKAEALAEREKKYESKVQELNLKENTTERRNRMDGLTKWLDKEKTFKLSAETEKRSSPVVRACTVAAVVGVCLAAGFGVRLVVTPDWRFVPGVSAGILLFVSTFVYYVRWSDKLFKDHARVEMRNRRLEADLQRAAWLSEMFFEAKEKDKQLPESFFEHFARGLFAEEQLNDVEHPVEGLARLARNISGLKVGKDGVDVSLKAPEK